MTTSPHDKRAGRDKRATAFAPATVGNAGVGFDILGFAVDAVGDRVTVERIDEVEVRIAGFTGLPVELPADPQKNTATVGLLRMIDDLGLDHGFEVTIDKGIPLGSGLGGSAASAVASVVAANALLASPLPTAELLPYALAGEAVASGSAHADNAAPCLLGGLVLVRGDDPPLHLPVPRGLWCALVHPHLRVDTRDARAVLPRELPLAAYVEQSGHLASFVAGCYTDDARRVATSCRDVLVEPFRATLVRGFDAARAAAHDAGALAFTLSGSGPTVFALCDDEGVARAVATAIRGAFEAGGVGADAWVSTIVPDGARLVDPEGGP